jgi:hypothetical protein
MFFKLLLLKPTEVVLKKTPEEFVGEFHKVPLTLGTQRFRKKGNRFLS